MTCSPVFTQNFSLAHPPTLLVPHGGIFDVSSLLSAAPCHTGAARGVPPQRGCRDTVPAMTRCGLPEQSSLGCGSTKTHKRSQQRRKAAQHLQTYCHRTLLACALFGNRTALQGFGSPSGSGVWPPRGLHPVLSKNLQMNRAPAMFWSGLIRLPVDGALSHPAFALHDVRPTLAPLTFVFGAAQ